MYLKKKSIILFICSMLAFSLFSLPRPMFKKETGMVIGSISIKTIYNKSFIYFDPDSKVGIVLSNIDSNKTYSTFSDENSHFFYFANLPPGQYKISSITLAYEGLHNHTSYYSKFIMSDFKIDHKLLTVDVSDKNISVINEIEFNISLSGSSSSNGNTDRVFHNLNDVKIYDDYENLVNLFKDVDSHNYWKEYQFINSVTHAEKKVMNTASEWQGTYDAYMSSDGMIKEFILFDDHTMTGSWVTLNGASTLKLNGTYILENNKITFSATGIILVRNIKSAFELTGQGTLNDSNGAGEFTITFDSKNIPDDSGTWNMSNIKIQNK